VTTGGFVDVDARGGLAQSVHGVALVVVHGAGEGSALLVGAVVVIVAVVCSFGWSFRLDFFFGCVALRLTCFSGL